MQAGQFDLQLALVAASPLCKDLQDEQRPVVDRQAQCPFEVALLRGAERLIKQHLAGATRMCQHPDFVRLAGTDKQRRVRRFALAGDAISNREPCSLRKQTEFFKLVVEMRKTEVHPNKNHRRRCRSGRTGGNQELDDSSAPTAENCTGRPGTMVEMACLYTICVTVLRSNTTYWSNDSI